MESVIWCILGIALILLSLVLVCVWMARTKKGDVGIYSYITWLLVFWGFYFVFSYASHLPRHSKDKKLTIEIRQELLNGKIISTDTIYKFTPKKK